MASYRSLWRHTCLSICRGICRSCDCEPCVTAARFLENGTCRLPPSQKKLELKNQGGGAEKHPAGITKIYHGASIWLSPSESHDLSFKSWQVWLADVNYNWLAL